VPPLPFANFLNNVSPSQISSRHRSFRWIAELHDTIRGAIPSFIELLKDARWQARVGAASALGKFAEQRESWPDIITTPLI
jgi:HEAT repeat protein